jgi:hypothetical protein
MKSLQQLVNDWKIAAGTLNKLQADTPRIFGTVAVRAVKDNFKKQGYDSGTGVQQWPERNAKTNTGYDKRHGVKGSVINSSNQLLIQTHNLINAIKYDASKFTVTVGVDLGIIPYAKIQNEGGRGIPARKYIPANNEPPNQKILQGVLKKVIFERDKALKDFKK